MYAMTLLEKALTDKRQPQDHELKLALKDLKKAAKLLRDVSRLDNQRIKQ